MFEVEMTTEKEPKNFHSPAMARMHGDHGRSIKVFCFFSSEKKTFLDV
jgi:hypothetical protein